MLTLIENNIKNIFSIFFFKIIFHNFFISTDVEKKETENICLEAINMIRESHKSLISNDARMREELTEIKKKYRHDSRRWRTNFRDLQQYYVGVKDAPPLVTATELSGGTPLAGAGSGGGSGGVVEYGGGSGAYGGAYSGGYDEVRGSGGGSSVTVGSPTKVKAAADELTNKVNEMERRSIEAAWGPEVGRAASSVIQLAEQQSQSQQNHVGGTASVELLSPTVSDGRKEALGSLSPIGRRRRQQQEDDDVKEEDEVQNFNSGSSPTKSPSRIRSNRSSSRSNSRSPAHAYTNSRHTQSSRSPAKARAQEQDELDRLALNRLNDSTFFTSASQQIEETSRN